MPLISDIRGETLQSPVLCSRDTGKEVFDTEHLALCIVDILTTPVGSRVMRRDYGSRLFQLVDRPIDNTLVMEMRAAVVDAIHRWEPRLRITRVLVDPTRWNEGKLLLDITGFYLLAGRPIRLQELSLDFFKQTRYHVTRPEELEAIAA